MHAGSSSLRLEMEVKKIAHIFSTFFFVETDGV
jgi:hypothetical protein